MKLWQKNFVYERPVGVRLGHQSGFPLGHYG